MKASAQIQHNERMLNRRSRWIGPWVNGAFSIWSYRAIRIILSGVFFWSGVSKLFSPESFAVIIDAYGLIPESWITSMSISLPALEVILAVGLLADIRGSLMMTALLLALFMAFWVTGYIWDLTWIVVVSAPKIRKRMPFMVFDPPFIGIW